MRLILDREVLHEDITGTYYKTYDTVKDLYGIYSDANGTIAQEHYLHIFKFKNTGFGVVDQLEQYFSLDLLGNRLDLSLMEENYWKSIIIKSSPCNCLLNKTTDSCSHCNREGSITNNFGMKILSNLL